MSRYWPIIILILLPVLIFWPLTMGGRVLYWGLPLYQFYPWHSLVVEAVRGGHLPLWTGLLGNGAPLLANHQSAVFYPLNLIYFVLPVERAMGTSVVLHLILAGLFAYGWGRAVGLSRFGATVVGLSFMLSAFLASRTQFITIVNVGAWLPLLFWLAHRMVQRRSLWDAIWLGVAIALQFLAGHAQLWFYSLWAVALYVLAEAWFVRRARSVDLSRGQPQIQPHRGHVIPLLAVALGLGVGLCAIQLLPTAELALQSGRADGLDPDQAMTYSFWPWRLLTLATPNLFGSPATGDYWGYATYWEDAGYLGALSLLLALTAVWAWGRRQASALFRRLAPGRWADAGGDPVSEAPAASGLQEDFLVPFFFCLSLFSLILAMGRHTPLYPFIFEHIPGFGAFRAPARFLLFYTLGVSTLAGIGADRFRLTYRAQYVARLTAAGAGAMLIISLVAWQMSQQIGLAIKPTFAPAMAWLALWLGLSAILLLLSPVRAGLKQKPNEADPRVARSPLSLGAWQALMVGLIAVDLALFAMPLTPTIEPELYQALTDADRYLLERADDHRLFAGDEYSYDTKFNRYFDFSGWGPSDLAHWLAFRESLIPNLAVYARAASVNNDDPLEVGHWGRLMDALQAADWPAQGRLLQMMNVGYLVAESPPAGLRPVKGVAHLYHLPAPLSRAWVVPQARGTSNPELLLSELTADAFEPGAEVLLEAPGYPADKLVNLKPGAGIPLADHPPELDSPSSAPFTATIALHEAWNYLRIELASPQPGYLVLAYTYYPGWQASVDSRPAAILRANYAFMALPVEAGEHQVILRYRPVSLALGALISGLSLLTVIAVAAVGWRRKRKA